MAGIFLLLGLCVVMALASFLAGALPLSMTLSQSHLKLLSSLGVGILVGTSLVVIIPEGVDAASAPGESAHIHRVRTLLRRSPWSADIRDFDALVPTMALRDEIDVRTLIPEAKEVIVTRTESERSRTRREDTPDAPDDHDHDHEESEVPTKEIGIALIVGFVLMFLIDRLPRHATERLHSAPTTQHMSLDNLGGDTAMDEETGFLGSLAPEPRAARSLATTTGLVIHAAADGIAMGASSVSSDMSLGFIIFFAIMIHKAPAAFGLTSVLLKQGLSKRAARGHLIVFSLAAPVGALTTWLLATLLGGEMEGERSNWWTGMLLLFSGGPFLYVAMQAMQEESGGHSHGHDHHGGQNGYANGSATKPKGPQMRDTLATMVGMLLPILTTIGHHH